MLIDRFSELPDNFAIFGAQVIAYGAFAAIKRIYKKVPRCFIVNSTEGNPSSIEGIPVLTPDAIPAETVIIPSVTVLLREEVIDGLKKRGFYNFFDFSQSCEHRLMKDYFDSLGIFPAGDGIPGNISGKTGLVMYAVQNDRDKPLKFPPELFSYEMPVQAGAAIAKKRIAPLGDNTGMNISEKNRMYCEMSALYWIWKNTDDKWTGLEHYRRRLLVTQQMLDSGADAVLPLPYMCYPDAETQLCRFVSQDTLSAMKNALKSLYPDEYESYMNILHGPYQYTYNLMCLKRYVLEDFCEWFFKITECMEDMADKVPDIVNTRALSYAAEALTNIYFMHNRNNIKIIHCEKNIYV